MKIAIATSALKTGYRIQGTGTYISNLLASLKRYSDKNEYISFSRTTNIPKNIDLVHYPYFNPFFLTLPLRKAFPTVVTVHDLIPIVFKEHFPAGLRGRLIWQVQRKLLTKLDAVIADSLSSKRDIIKYTDIASEKVHVVYLAAGEEFKKVQSSKFPPKARLARGGKVQSLKEKYGLPEKFVLYVGDVLWSKNIPHLIRAIRTINITLVMVGKKAASQDFDKNHPWNRDRVILNELARDDKRIIRLGFVSNEDLVSLYNMATLFVMPSFYEGFGLPVLEAMSCGLPVVTTKGGSLPEVVEDAAMFVDPYDVSSIANGIGEVFFNKKLQSELSKKGIEQVKKFSWEKTARETVKVYRKVLSIKY